MKRLVVIAQRLVLAALLFAGFVVQANAKTIINQVSQLAMDENAGAYGYVAGGMGTIVGCYNPTNLGEQCSFRVVTPPPAVATLYQAFDFAGCGYSCYAFTPALNWWGITYVTVVGRTATGGDSDPLTMQLIVRHVNQPPAAQNLSIVTAEDTAGNVTATVTDPDYPSPGDSHSLQIVAQSGYGWATISGDKLTFTPAANWNGSTSFSYRVVDAAGLASPTYTVNVTVTPVNDAPVASQINITTNESRSGSATVIVTDPDIGDSHSLAVTQPTVGSVTVSGLTATYTPPNSWFGTTSFTYRVKDAAGAYSSWMTANVTVVKTNYAPTGTSLTIATKEDQNSPASTPSVVDPNTYDAGTHTIQIVTPPAHGTIQIVNSGRSVIYVPAFAYVGPDTFVYKAIDPAGAAVQGTATVTVTAFNYAPTSTTATMTGNEGQLVGPVMPTTVDPNAWDSFRYEIVSQPAHGKATVGTNGLEYVPDEGFVGDDTFVIRAIDKAGEAVEGTATVKVLPFNYAPLDIKPASIQVTAGVGGWGDLQTVDRNLWDSFTYTIVAQPAAGAAWIEGNRLFFTAVDSAVQKVRVRSTDAGGLYIEKDIVLQPGSAVDLAATKTVVSTGLTTKVPAVTTSLRDAGGHAAFYQLLNKNPEFAATTDRGIVVYVAPESAVGLVIEGKALNPGEAAYLPKAAAVSAQAIEFEIAGSKLGDSGRAIVRFGPYYGSDTWFEFNVDEWTLHGAINPTKSPVIQSLERTAANVAAKNAGDCAITGQAAIAQQRSPFTTPTCYVSWDSTYPGAADTSWSDGVRIEGYATAAGTHALKATAYVVDSKGQKYALGQYTGQIEVSPVDGVISIVPTQPIDGVFAQVQETELAFKQNKGPTCTLTSSLAKAKRDPQQNLLNPTCLVEWTSLPQGMQQRGNYDPPYLVGTVDTLGTNTVQWRISTFDVAGNQYAIASQQYQFNTVLPPALSFAMDARNLLGGQMYAAPLSGGYLGDIVASGYNAPVKFQSSVAGSLVESQVIPRGFGSAATIRRRVDAQAKNVLWQHTSYAYSAQYSDMDTSYIEKTLDVVSVPDATVLPVLDDTDTTVMTTESLDLNVHMRDVLDPSKSYSVDTMGAWSIQLATVKGWNQYTPITDAAETDADGNVHFSLPMQGLAGSNLRIVAIAKIISPVAEYQSTRMSSKQLFVSVINGDALNGGLQALRLSGQAPFRTTIVADLAKPEWYRDIGSVAWEVSSDAGGSWKPIANQLAGQSVTRLTATFQTKGKYLIRATITNKHSGETALLNPIELTVFEVPVARVYGPNNIFVGGVGHYHVRDLQGNSIDASDKVIEWSLDRGKTWEPGGLDLDVQSNDLVTKYVYARIRYQDSPADNDQAYKVVKTSATFRPIRAPRMQILGPIRPEMGKQATYTAVVRMPYINMDGTATGEFTLPDGSIVAGKTATYTPTQANVDAGTADIAFHGWVEGYKDAGAEDTVKQRLRFWFYDWPHFSITPTVSAGFAPADVTLRVRRDGGFLQLDGVKYVWHLPENPAVAIVREDFADSRAIKITAAGEYIFTVDVTDARGNFATAQLKLVIQDPPPYQIGMKYSASNAAQRAPLDLSMRPDISGGHPLDRIQTYQYLINGKPVEGATERYSNVRLPEPGTYTVGLQITTRMGAAAAGEKEIVVVQNQPPTCTLKVVEGSSSWMASAACTDPDGRVTAYKWAVNGADQALTSSSITISKLQSPTAPAITMYAVDDAGGRSQTLSW